jgi:hypothetical protein
MAFVFPDRVSVQSRSLHVATLASLAVAQPLFDLLGKAPEFLLAHDLGPAEIVALVVFLGGVLPIACGAIVAMLERVHAPSARVAASVMVSFFVTLVALYALRNLSTTAWAAASVAGVAGVMVGVSYHRAAVVRSFTAWLAPGLVVVPALFLLGPEVQSLVWPKERAALQSSTSSTPVVFVVFDGLPLTALLDEHHSIDREHYPSFAALADTATWYRNATTVSDYTQWAVPAIVSGRYPVARALPIASDHPNTLFTLLGSSHAIKAHEPISRLCPPTLCDHGGAGIWRTLSEFAPTLWLVYLHAVLPAPVQGKLPPIDDGWADGVPPSDTPGEVWLRAGDHSRRGEAVAFINAIDSDGPQPSLYFLHVLLPHIPLAYLPGGQRYGVERTLPGLLDTRDRWVDDEWAATQGYRRFLLQVGYVDTLLGQLVERLKQVDLYNRALVVVTSDHGGSFKPGHQFRRLSDATIADIVPIPLFIKSPHQREGGMSDRNIETIDILPTIADIMDIDLPWQPDGISAVGHAAPRADKTVYHDNARKVKTLSSSLRDAVDAAVNNKLRLFGTDKNPYLIPRDSPRRDLIGRAVDDLNVSDVADDIDFSLDLYGDFANVDPRSRFLPAHLAGRARWRDSRDPAVVAIAVNGVVRVTTRTYEFVERGVEHPWSVVIPPDAFQAGENEVEVFVVRPSGTPVLHRTHFSQARPVDLLSNAAAYGIGVSYEGLYDRERTRGNSFRWTNGAATIVVPRRGRRVARSLRVNLATAGPADKDLLIRANGCKVFEGTVPAGRWSRIVAVPQCEVDENATVIEVQSGTHRDSPSGRDLGVAIERMDLLDEPWPPPTTPLPGTGRRSQLRFSSTTKDGDVVDSDSRVMIVAVNRGTSIWATPDALGQEHGSVRLGVLWFLMGETAQPVAVQRIELPRPLIPGDSVEVAVQLAPVAGNGKPLPSGQYEAWIGLLEEGVNWFYTTGDSVRKLRVVHDARP